MTQLKKWINQGGTYSYASIPEVNDKLLPGIYELGLAKTGFFLDKISNDFILPSKVYESERALIDRSLKSFNGFNKNFGILLKGLKGTGKTVTAKQICNEVNLPVILVNSHFHDIGNFINSINQDVVLFFDEFEKTYRLNQFDEEDHIMEADGKAGVGNLLTLMDGVFTSEYKRLFILTTNKEYMPDSIMSRPSRIRYIKDFSDLSYDGIMEILNDLVQNKKLIPELVNLMKEFSIITVDIVKSIAEEANMYNTSDSSFFEIFNVKREESFSDIMQLDKNGEESNCLVSKTKISRSNLYVAYTFATDNGIYLKVVRKMDENGVVLVKDTSDNKSIPFAVKLKKHKITHSSFTELIM